MKTKIFTLIFLFTTSIILSSAQTININGRILNQYSDPVNGVKVTLNGKGISTYSDIQGNFAIIENTTGIELNDEETKPVLFDGQAVYFTCNNHRVISSIHTITGQLMEQLVAPNTYSRTYKFYPSAYLPEADGKIYIISVNTGDQLYSLKIFNSNPNYFDKGIQPAGNTNDLNLIELHSTGKIFTKSAEVVNGIDKLILEHGSYNNKEVSISSYNENIGDVTLYQIVLPSISAPSSSDGSFTITMSYAWGTDLASSSDRYELEESTTSASSGFAKINNSTFGVRPASYDVTLTRSSGTYYYRARVYDKFAFSGYTNVISVAVTAASIPNAPSNLTVEASDPKTIRLKWVDNSNNETGFEIQRQNASNTAQWDIVTTTNANTTSFNHTNLSATWLGYRVRAINSGGNSAWTNISYAPRILRIVNDLYSSTTGFGDWGILNQIVRVRIANTESDVMNTKNYERLNPREIVYDIALGNNISPNYNQSSSYKDFEIDSYNGINTKYYVFIQCGWWDFRILGSSTWWEIQDTEVYCTDGVSACYKYVSFWANHYNGYIVVNASQFLPHGHWNNTKSTYDQSVSQK